MYYVTYVRTNVFCSLSSHYWRLYKNRATSTCECERSMKAVPRAEKGAGRSSEGSTQDMIGPKFPPLTSKIVEHSRFLLALSESLTKGIASENDVLSFCLVSQGSRKTVQCCLEKFCGGAIEQQTIIHELLMCLQANHEIFI